jgi:hypothetical protein
VLCFAGAVEIQGRPRKVLHKPVNARPGGEFWRGAVRATSYGGTCAAWFGGRASSSLRPKERCSSCSLVAAPLPAGLSNPRVRSGRKPSNSDTTAHAAGQQQGKDGVQA